MSSGGAQALPPGASCYFFKKKPLQERLPAAFHGGHSRRGMELFLPPEAAKINTKQLM
jgi:hypothetical protein